MARPLTSQERGYARPEALVSTAWLAERLGAPDIRVVDGSWYLPAMKRDPKAEFQAEHIPGAVYFDIDEIADTDSPLPHMLPSPEKFASRAKKLGLGDGNRIVVYDGLGLFSAARVWWMFRVFGHDDVAVLDGGMRRWQQLDLPLDDEVRARAPGDFVATPRPDLAVDAAAVLAQAGDRTARILDVRAPERYRGEVEPIDAVAGHVPGARNHPFTTSLDASGRFLPATELRAALSHSLGGVPPERTIAMCGSGVTACHLLLAMEHAGLHGARLYPGSWSEWSRDPSRPVRTGDSP